MKKFIFLLLLLVGCAPIHAKQSKGLEGTMEDVATDLANLHQEIQAAYQTKEDILSLIDRIITISAENAKVYSGTDVKSAILKTVSKGQEFKVIDKINDWYAVAFEQPEQGMYAGWVNAAEAVPKPSFTEWIEAKESLEEPKSAKDQIYEKIMTSVKGFRDKYENNPYVTITGFSVNIGVPPSVSVSFEFK